MSSFMYQATLVLLKIIAVGAVSQHSSFDYGRSNDIVSPGCQSAVSCFSEALVVYFHNQLFSSAPNLLQTSDLFFTILATTISAYGMRSSRRSHQHAVSSRLVLPMSPVYFRLSSRLGAISPSKAVATHANPMIPTR